MRLIRTLRVAYNEEELTDSALFRWDRDPHLEKLVRLGTLETIVVELEYVDHMKPITEETADRLALMERRVRAWSAKCRLQWFLDFDMVIEFDERKVVSGDDDGYGFPHEIIEKAGEPLDQEVEVALGGQGNEAVESD